MVLQTFLQTNNINLGGLVAQAVRRSPPTAGVPSSRLGPSMWVSWGAQTAAANKSKRQRYSEHQCHGSFQSLRRSGFGQRWTLGLPDHRSEWYVIFSVNRSPPDAAGHSDNVWTSVHAQRDGFRNCERVDASPRVRQGLDGGRLWSGQRTMFSLIRYW